MSTPELKATSGILYLRAGLRPFGRAIRDAGGLLEFLRTQVEHDELFAPFFRRARPLWEPRPRALLLESNSGALGVKLSQCDGAVMSRHPSHRFVGFGPRVAAALQRHDHRSACFGPVNELASEYDFSMLLVGCNDVSPGFSTVHASQYALGLTQKHLSRYLVRWDFDGPAGGVSMVPPESPGCSMSFGKFYSHYEHDGNLLRGEMLGQPYLFVPSAARAMAVERRILAAEPRFVDCGRRLCSTCRLRLY